MKRKIVTCGLFVLLLIGGMNVHASACQDGADCKEIDENFQIFSDKEIKRAKVGLTITVILAGFVLYKYHKNK